MLIILRIEPPMNDQLESISSRMLQEMKRGKERSKAPLFRYLKLIVISSHFRNRMFCGPSIFD